MCLFPSFYVRAAPCVLRERGRHTERQQPDHCVHRRPDVLLESGHAFPATGTPHPEHHLTHARGLNVYSIWAHMSSSSCVCV